MVAATRQTLVWPRDANSQAVTYVNPDVASSYRASRDGGTGSAEPLFPRRRLIHRELGQEITRWLPGVSGMACEESHEG